MTTSYYDRTVQTYIDGTPIFKTPQDEASEAFVAKELGEIWGCRFVSFGKLSVIDWYVERNGRVVGLAELKTRDHNHDKYHTVFLNIRKWLALMLGSAGMGVPAIFVARFQDGTRWIKVSDIDPNRITIGGCKEIVKSRNDREPVIEVDISKMRPAQIRPDSVQGR